MQQWWIITHECDSFDEHFVGYVRAEYLYAYLATYLADNHPQTHCENISHLLRRGKESTCLQMNLGLFLLNTFHYIASINVWESPPYDRKPSNLFYCIASMLAFTMYDATTKSTHTKAKCSKFSYSLWLCSFYFFKFTVQPINGETFQKTFVSPQMSGRGRELNPKPLYKWTTWFIVVKSRGKSPPPSEDTAQFNDL